MMLNQLILRQKLVLEPSGLPTASWIVKQVMSRVTFFAGWAIGCVVTSELWTKEWQFLVSRLMAVADDKSDPMILIDQGRKNRKFSSSSCQGSQSRCLFSSTTDSSPMDFLLAGEISCSDLPRFPTFSRPTGWLKSQFSALCNHSLILV